MTQTTPHASAEDLQHATSATPFAVNGEHILHTEGSGVKADHEHPHNDLRRGSFTHVGALPLPPCCAAHCSPDCMQMYGGTVS